jgi:hypothetical protein
LKESDQAVGCHNPGRGLIAYMKYIDALLIAEYSVIPQSE